MHERCHLLIQIVARKILAAKFDRDANGTYQQLSEMDPKIKLLYVTPEKVENA